MKMSEIDKTFGEAINEEAIKVDYEVLLARLLISPAFSKIINQRIDHYLNNNQSTLDDTLASILNREIEDKIKDKLDQSFEEFEEEIASKYYDKEDTRDKISEYLNDYNFEDSIQEYFQDYFNGWFDESYENTDTITSNSIELVVREQISDLLETVPDNPNGLCNVGESAKSALITLLTRHINVDEVITENRMVLLERALEEKLKENTTTEEEQ